MERELRGEGREREKGFLRLGSKEMREVGDGITRGWGWGGVGV